MANIDLHSHTNCSDGLLTPDQLVALAAERGVRHLAVTDHDTVEGIAAALAAGARLGVEVIPGVELSTDIEGAEIHVLGYYIDWQNAAFRAELAELRDSRVGRGQAMVAKLAALGKPIGWDQVLAIAGDAAIGRPHIARALVAAGHVKTVAEAFDRYIGHGGPAYAERERLTPVEAVQTIRRANGLPSLAHPVFVGSAPAHTLRYTFPLEPMLGQLVPAGLVGLDCYYHGYTPEVTNHLLKLARQYRLIPTGGSDFHGSGVHEGSELGGVDVPTDSLKRLKAAKSAVGVRP